MKTVVTRDFLHVRSEVMQITFNCQNSIVFNACLSKCSVTSKAPNLERLASEMGLDKGYFDRIYGTFLLWLC